jgi:hypothetical protein
MSVSTFHQPTHKHTVGPDVRRDLGIVFEHCRDVLQLGFCLRAYHCE